MTFIVSKNKEFEPINHIQSTMNQGKQSFVYFLLAKAKETFVIPFNGRHYLLGDDREGGWMGY